MQALDSHIAHNGFRLRGVAMSRIDAFSDVIFGFALTLLVVSLEVPHTFAELDHSLRGFIPFAICFILLLLIWYSHYKFFRRYGLHDTGTIALNAGLLFVVLFYVYPLKFLFTVLTEGVLGHNSAAFGGQHDMRELMVLYGLGFAAVYLLLTALYVNACRQRESLELNAVERLLTRSSTVEYAAMGSIGLLSAAVAVLVPSEYSGYSGFLYLMLVPVGRLHQHWERGRLRALHASLDAGGV